MHFWFIIDIMVWYLSALTQYLNQLSFAPYWHVICSSYMYIKNNACVTMNNNWSHKWKSMANRFTHYPKVIIHGNEFNSLHAIFCPEHTIPLKTLSIADFPIDSIFWLSIVTSAQLIHYVTRMWVIGIVTSYSSIVLERANWRKSDLH